MAKPRRASSESRSRHALVVPKSLLAQEIRRAIATKELSQLAAAVVMREAPSQVSLVLSGHLHGFSADRLLRMLLRLGRDVDILVRPSTRRGRPGRVRVIADSKASAHPTRVPAHRREPPRGRGGA
jgi:predicted XRE-type DNA-binding protein